MNTPKTETTFKIDAAADLEDLFGGQTDFEVAVWVFFSNGERDIVGAGHTVAEAVAEARETLRGWRQNEAPSCEQPSPVLAAEREARRW